MWHKKKLKCQTFPLSWIFLTDLNGCRSSIGSGRHFRMSMSNVDRTEVHIELFTILLGFFLRRRCWSCSRVASYCWAIRSATALSIVPVELVHGEILRLKPRRQVGKKSVKLSFDTCLSSQNPLDITKNDVIVLIDHSGRRLQHKWGCVKITKYGRHMAALRENIWREGRNYKYLVLHYTAENM